MAIEVMSSCSGGRCRALPSQHCRWWWPVVSSNSCTVVFHGKTRENVQCQVTKSDEQNRELWKCKGCIPTQNSYETQKCVFGMMMFLFTKGDFEVTPWKFDMAPEISHPKMKVIFQPSFFRGELLNFGGVHVGFYGGGVPVVFLGGWIVGANGCIRYVVWSDRVVTVRDGSWLTSPSFAAKNFYGWGG